MLTRSNLHPYQRATVEHIHNTPRCGVFLEMGLGKTVSTLTAINDLMFEEFEISTVLVIAPKRVATSVWPQEVKEWGHLKDLVVCPITGPEHKRINALNSVADIYTIGRDSVAWLCDYYGSKLPFDMVVIDESSSFKNAKSQRFKALRRSIAGVPRVVLLTGTPSPNSLMDLWAQIYLIDQGQRLGKYITNYRSNFFKAGASNGHIVYKYRFAERRQRDKIHDAIGDVCISMKAEDHLSLPERVDNMVRVKLPGTVKKAYADFEKSKVLELLDNTEDGVITAANAAALSNKLLQFSNGAVYDEDRNVKDVHSAKLEALEEIIESANGKPVLLAYSFKHDLSRILAKFKKLNPKTIDTQQDIDDWNAGKIQLACLHPASGGHGLNLQKGGNTIVWFGPTWSLELYQQFNARLHRQGQTESVVIHHIVCEGTVDEKVIKAIDKKATTQDGLMAAVKALVKEHFNV